MIIASRSIVMQEYRYQYRHASCVLQHSEKRQFQGTSAKPQNDPKIAIATAACPTPIIPQNMQLHLPGLHAVEGRKWTSSRAQSQPRSWRQSLLIDGIQQERLLLRCLAHHVAKILPYALCCKISRHSSRIGGVEAKSMHAALGGRLCCRLETSEASSSTCSETQASPVLWADTVMSSWRW